MVRSKQPTPAHPQPSVDAPAVNLLEWQAKLQVVIEQKRRDWFSSIMKDLNSTLGCFLLGLLIQDYALALSTLLFAAALLCYETWRARRLLAGSDIIDRFYRADPALKADGIRFGLDRRDFLIVAEQIRIDLDIVIGNLIRYTIPPDGDRLARIAKRLGKYYVLIGLAFMLYILLFVAFVLQQAYVPGVLPKFPESLINLFLVPLWFAAVLSEYRGFVWSREFYARLHERLLLGEVELR